MLHAPPQMPLYSKTAHALPYTLPLQSFFLEPLSVEFHPRHSTECVKVLLRLLSRCPKDIPLANCTGQPLHLLGLDIQASFDAAGYSLFLESLSTLRFQNIPPFHPSPSSLAPSSQISLFVLNVLDVYIVCS